MERSWEGTATLVATFENVLRQASIKSASDELTLERVTEAMMGHSVW